MLCYLANKTLFPAALVFIVPGQRPHSRERLSPPSGLHRVLYDGDGLQDHCLRPLLLLPEEVEHLRLCHRHREPAGAERIQEGQPVCAPHLPLGNVLSGHLTQGREADPWGDRRCVFGDQPVSHTRPILVGVRQVMVLKSLETQLGDSSFSLIRSGVDTLLCLSFFVPKGTSEQRSILLSNSSPSNEVPTADIF